ncbi:MAG: hypothetical protein WCG23_06195 [bacterium]
MLNLNSVLNRQVPQKKSLSFGISPERLKELMDSKNISLQVDPIKDTKYLSGTLKYNGCDVFINNNTLISQTAKSEPEILSGLAKSIPEGSTLSVFIARA